MSKRNDEEMAEFRQEMLDEARADELHEIKLHGIYDYALEQYEDDIQDAIDILHTVTVKLASYGWEVTIKELVDV